MFKPKIICVTPIKNEAWILDLFLKSASLWADYIILADQKSTDNTKEIAIKYKKVILIENEELKYFDEYRMRKTLYDEAKKIQGSKLLVSIDADEIFTPNILDSDDWKNVVSCKPGTVIKFQLANLRPDLKTYWSPNVYFPRAFMDDGTEYKAGKIHTINIPLPENPNILEVKTIKIMHFQFVDWDRMKSKHRWYQCWERINNPSRGTISIYRQYHHMFAYNKNQYKEIPSEWFNRYLNESINLKDFIKEKSYWWDRIVLNYFKEFAPKYFRKESIWYVDWNRISKLIKYDLQIKDPRKIQDRIIQFYLRKTQKYYPIKIIQKLDNLINKFYA